MHLIASLMHKKMWSKIHPSTGTEVCALWTQQDYCILDQIIAHNYENAMLPKHLTWSWDQTVKWKCNVI